jgi:hypothetical protein
LLEPVEARITWKQAERVEAFALDSSGRRAASVPLEETPEGFRLRFDGISPGLHWELATSPGPSPNE